MKCEDMATSDTIQWQHRTLVVLARLTCMDGHAFFASNSIRFARQLQLVLALAVRAQSQAGGVSKTNAYINVLEAFTTHVLPEIQVNKYMCRTDCLASGGVIFGRKKALCWLLFGGVSFSVLC